MKINWNVGEICYREKRKLFLLPSELIYFEGTVPKHGWGWVEVAENEL